jgi:hypothetical protein
MPTVQQPVCPAVEQEVATVPAIKPVQCDFRVVTEEAGTSS